MSEGVNPKDLVGAKKAPLSLVPPALVIAASDALQLGAEKYGPYNWRDYPVQLMTYLEAAMRHLLAYQDGQDLDPESGKSHLSHAAACLAIVLDCLESGTLVDNRPKPGPAPKMLNDRDMSAKEKALEEELFETLNQVKAEYLEYAFPELVDKPELVEEPVPLTTLAERVPAPEAKLPLYDRTQEPPIEGVTSMVTPTTRQRHTYEASMCDDTGCERL